MLITLDLTGEEIKVLKDVTSSNGIGARPHSIYNSIKESLYNKVKHALIISTEKESVINSTISPNKIGKTSCKLIKTDAISTVGCKITISTKDC
jgi:hypothetical protein